MLRTKGTLGSMGMDLGSGAGVGAGVGVGVVQRHDNF